MCYTSPVSNKDKKPIARAASAPRLPIASAASAPRLPIASAASDPQDIYDCRTCGACCAPEINDALYVGVTASDMAVWQQHIRQLDEDTQTSLFAVLNKIDVLWDDLAGEAFVQNAIRQIQTSTARQLGIRMEDVLPLSAKQAMARKASRSSLPPSRMSSRSTWRCPSSTALPFCAC